MKLINKILLAVSALITMAIVVASCDKKDALTFYHEGNDITLTSSSNAIAPTLADSMTNVVTFSWTNPGYSTDSTNQKFILEIDSATRNFSKASAKIVMASLNTSLTGGELNNILLNYGFTIGTPYNLDVRVIASYGNNNERRLSNVVSITVTPYNHPSTLTTEKTSVSGTLATAANHSNTFNWSNSFPGYSGNITYDLEYDSATKNFASLHSIPAGVNLNNISLTEAQMNETALNEAVPATTTGKIEYRIKATTAQGAISYSNTVAVTIQTYLPIQKIYLVGSINGWDIANPLEMINDPKSDRFNTIFYTYVKLDAGAEFKFAKIPGDWSSCYGNSGTSGTGFNTGYNQGGNFQVSAAGIYRLTIDIVNNLAWVQQKQVGIVGDMQTPATWNPASPIYGGYVSRDKFIIITPSNGSAPFKFHDGPDWDNSAPDKARWWGDAGSGNLDNDGNGGNIIANSSPRTRAIWNGEDKLQVKYELSPAVEMRVVGDGINGVTAWDPASSPQMTYSGNGVWTITIDLVANKSIKFLAGDAWGAFDYEDASGGSTATGTPRSIKWDGGPDFKTPATSGTYTITLDEHAQTVTIN